MFDTKFLARNLALVGSVCLLLAEVMGETRTIFAGVPTLDDNQSKNYLQLSGKNLKFHFFLDTGVLIAIPKKILISSETVIDTGVVPEVANPRLVES